MSRPTSPFRDPDRRRRRGVYAVAVVAGVALVLIVAAIIVTIVRV